MQMTWKRDFQAPCGPAAKPLLKVPEVSSKEEELEYAWGSFQVSVVRNIGAENRWHFGPLFTDFAL